MKPIVPRIKRLEAACRVSDRSSPAYLNDLRWRVTWRAREKYVHGHEMRPRIFLPEDRYFISRRFIINMLEFQNSKKRQYHEEANTQSRQPQAK